MSNGRRRTRKIDRAQANLFSLFRLLEKCSSLPFTTTTSGVAIGGGHAIPNNHLAIPIWKRKLLRKKKTEEEIQEEAKNTLLRSTGPIKAKYLRSLSEKDLHTYTIEHIDRLDPKQSAKFAKYLEKKARKHSQIRNDSLDAICTRLGGGDYEKAHWAKDYAETARLAYGRGETVAHLHQVITKEQEEIDRILKLSQGLENHVQQLWAKHKAQRKSEGKSYKSDVKALLEEAHKKATEVEKYPNIKETFERENAKKQEKIQEAARIAEEKERARQEKKSSSVSSRLGRIFSFGSSSGGSSKNGSKNGSSKGNTSSSSSSSESEKDKGTNGRDEGEREGSSRRAGDGSSKGKKTVTFSEEDKDGSNRSSQNGEGSSNGRYSSSSSDEEDRANFVYNGPGRSPSTTWSPGGSMTNSPNSVLDQGASRHNSYSSASFNKWGKPSWN